MEFVTTADASKYLVDAVPGETEQYWSRRLTNLRRADRTQPYELNFCKYDGKTGLYKQQDIVAFAEFEKTRRLGEMKLTGRAAAALRAFGVGEPGGGSRGREFNGSANLQPADGGHPPIVQLIINNPLLVFALSPARAWALGNELIESANVAKRHYGAEACGFTTGADK